jgi:thiol peroxidase
MSERTVTMHGNELVLVGNEPQVGQALADVELSANDLSAVKLSSFRGKVCVITTIPSLDTPVCDIMTRRFNKEAVSLGDDVAVLAVSTDLPFAQARWCGAAEADNIQSLSDHRDATFGESFGVLLRDLRLLARAVFVLDKEGVLRYVEIVGELTEEPDYDAALKAVSELL